MDTDDKIKNIKEYIELGKIYTLDEWAELWTTLWKKCLTRHSHVLDVKNKYYDGFYFSFYWDQITVHDKNCNYIDMMYSCNKLTIKDTEIYDTKTELSDLNPNQYVPKFVKKKDWKEATNEQRLKWMRELEPEYIPIYDKEEHIIKKRRGYHPPEDKNWVNVKNLDKKKLLFKIWSHASKMKYEWTDEIIKLHWNRYIDQGDCFREIDKNGNATFIHFVKLAINIFETIDNDIVYKNWIDPTSYDELYGKESFKKIVYAM